MLYPTSVNEIGGVHYTSVYDRLLSIRYGGYATTHHLQLKLAQSIIHTRDTSHDYQIIDNIVHNNIHLRAKQHHIKV